MRGHLDGLLLAALAAAPGHGYEISQRLTGASGSTISPTEGSTYPAPHPLERSRLLTSEWSVHAGRRRRVYALTAAGRRAMDDAQMTGRRSRPRSIASWTWPRARDRRLPGRTRASGPYAGSASPTVPRRAAPTSPTLPRSVAR